MKKKYIIASGIVSLILIIALTWGVIADSRFLGVCWVKNAHGLCYVSDSYAPNSNISYSVAFHEVNFTFLYWFYPMDIADIDYSAYFAIEYQSSAEQVFLLTGGYWRVTGSVQRSEFTVTTTIASLTAGILAGGYLDSPVSWRFVVSMN